MSSFICWSNLTHSALGIYIQEIYLSHFYGTRSKALITALMLTLISRHGLMIPLSSLQNRLSRDQIIINLVPVRTGFIKCFVKELPTSTIGVLLMNLEILHSGPSKSF